VKIVGEMEIFSFSSSSLRSLVERRELLELGEKMNLALISLKEIEYHPQEFKYLHLQIEMGALTGMKGMIMLW
jgi:hypothetical protein